MEDEKIVQMYLDRDEHAVHLTAEKYGARLRQLSLGITSDVQTAEECENDTYLETWNRIPPAEPKCYFYAFLARITRAISIDRCRQRSSLKRDGHIVELTAELETCLPAAIGVEDALAEKLLGEAISRFLRTLSDEKQIIFIRRYFYLDSTSEISARLSISQSKVKMTLLRIRSDLRAYLIREGYTL